MGGTGPWSVRLAPWSECLATTYIIVTKYRSCRYVANKVGRVVNRSSGLGEMTKSKPPVQDFRERKVEHDTVTGEKPSPGPDVVKYCDNGRQFNGSIAQDTGNLSHSQ